MMATLIPCVAIMPYIDECLVVAFGLIMVYDCMRQGKPGRYRLAWIVTSVMTVYAVYSLIIASNSAVAIAVDYVVQLKPLLPFAIVLVTGLHLTPSQRIALRCIAVANVLSILWIVSLPEREMTEIIRHEMYVGSTVFVSAVAYWMCGMDEHGDYSPGTLAAVLAMLAAGCVCGRAKYYASALACATIAIVCCRQLTAFFVRYRFVIFTAVLAIIAVVAWEKIEYYFFGGTRTRANPSEMFEMARPALYVTSLAILMDYFPFGSGLASFATGASANYYSDTYFEYGLNHVWGLSPGFNQFCTDAFLPSLAQFGVVGVGLFVAFWTYVVKLVHRCPMRGWSGMAWAIMINLGIDAVAQTSLVQQSGMCSMMMLAMVCGKCLRTEQGAEASQSKAEIKLRPLIS